MANKWFYTLKGDKSLFDSYPMDKTWGKLIVCSAINYRLFSLFTYTDFYKYNLSLKAEERCFFEIILGSAPQKDHLDIEITDEDVKGEDLDHTGERLMNQIIKGVKAEYKKEDVELLDNNILIFSSHGPKKRSFHIVIDGYARSNNKECQNFYERVKCHIDEDIKKYVDASVYKSVQQFRLLGSQKYGSNRPKIFLPQWSFGDVKGQFKNDEEWPTNRIDYFIWELSLVSRVCECKIMKNQVIPVKKPIIKGQDIKEDEIYTILDMLALKLGINRNDSTFPFDVRSVEGSMLLLKRRRPSMCFLCNRKHEHENPFISTNTQGHVFFNCRRSERGEKIGQLEKEEEKKEEKKETSNIKSLLDRLQNIKVPKTAKKKKEGISIEEIQEYIFSDKKGPRVKK